MVYRLKGGSDYDVVVQERDALTVDAAAAQPLKGKSRFCRGISGTLI